MTPGLANRCTWLQVYSVLAHMMVYHISKVCLALMYMQHRHMVYRELHRHHYLFYQSASGNAYSAPLRHEVWNVDQKMVMLGISSCYNKFSYLFVQHQNYLDYDTVCLSIIFPWIFLIFPDHWHHFCGYSFVRFFGTPWLNLHHCLGC